MYAQRRGRLRAYTRTLAGHGPLSNVRSRTIVLIIAMPAALCSLPISTTAHSTMIAARCRVSTYVLASRQWGIAMEKGV